MRTENIISGYMEGMCRRDIDRIASCLCEASTIVMLNGVVYRGADAILDMHRAWFEDADWRVAYKVESIRETEKVCHALVLIDYEDKTEDGQPYQIQYYLFLLFGKEEGTWKLLHDQNTMIRG